MAAPNKTEGVFWARVFVLIARTVFKRMVNIFILVIDSKRTKMIQTVLRPSRSECFVDKVCFFDYYCLRFKTFLIMRSVMDLFLTA